MYITYLFFAVFILALLGIVIYAVLKKHYLDIFIFSLILVFAVTSLINILCGGSAFHDAESDYQLYQAGHYYLVSHGVWTDVTYQTYMLAMISEFAGIVSFSVGFVLCIIREIRKRFFRK